MMTFKMETVVHPPVKLNLAFIVMENLLFLYVFLYLHSTIVEMESLRKVRNVMMQTRLQMMDVVQIVHLKKDFIAMNKEYVKQNAGTA